MDHGQTSEREAEREAALGRDYEAPLEVLRALPEGLLRLARDGEVVFANPAAEQALGLRPGEWKGRHLFEIVRVYGGEGRTQALDFAVVLDHLSTGRPWCRDNAWLVRSDERAIPASYLLAPIFSGGQLRGAVFTFRDLTERRRADRALHEARVELATAAKAEAVRDALFATVTHDVLAPLDTLISATERLAAVRLPDPAATEVETARAAARALRSVLGDLLDWARIETDALEIAPIEFDLTLAIREVAELARPAATDRGIAIRAKLDLDHAKRVVGDPGRIRQVLAHLVASAIRATTKGEVTIAARTTWRSRSDAMVRIEVSDTGPGTADRDWMGTVRDLAAGESGITPLMPRNGLPLARRLVELMDGALGGEVQPGVGSTRWFELRLPLGSLAPRSLRSADLRGVRALVVDSSDAGRESLVRDLSAVGLRCTATASGGQALRLLRAGLEQWDPYRIAVLTAPLREMDAATLGDLVKGDPRLRDTSLVYLAAVGGAGDARRLEAIGFVAYLVQPVLPELLHTALSVVWATKLTGTSAGLVTRHSLADSRILQLSPQEIRERASRFPRDGDETPSPKGTTSRSS